MDILKDIANGCKGAWQEAKDVWQAISHPGETIKSGINEGIKTSSNWIVDDFYIFFVLTGIVGMYFIMIGERKIGTKITSISILSYLLVKVVSMSYA